jgi:hypothetical protein
VSSHQASVCAKKFDKSFRMIADRAVAHKRAMKSADQPVPSWIS